jgi:hypothetical protein
METNVQSERYFISSPDNTETVQVSSSETQPQDNIETIQVVPSETQPKLPPANESPFKEVKEQWREIGVQVSSFLKQLPRYTKDFFEAYKLPIISFAALLATIVVFKIVLAVMDALNDIPLLSASLELIGIGFIIWFVVRYLLNASTRQELAVEIKAIKEQILGKSSSETLSK